ncbi:MAG: flippase-like domain-containing protein [Verrucomicrobiota bacterium]|nr:flippase-like domain-containing protein [Verrucomicrobiota bacterium]
MKKYASRVVQIAITVAILAWIFRDPALRSGIVRAIRGADARWLLAGVFISGVGEIANIWRWGIFLRMQNIAMSWKRITAIFMIGVFFNLFLFGSTGGDILKVIYLSRDYPHRKGVALLTVIADRWIGLMILIPFTVVVVAWRYAWLSRTPTAAALLWVLNIFTITMSIIMAASYLIASRHVVHRLPARMPGRETLVRLGETFAVFGRSWRQTLAALILSVPILFTFFGTFYCAARAFAANVSLVDIFSVMPVITVVTSLPISFGGLGVREKLFESLLGDLAAVPAELAVLISLVGFAIYLVWSLVGAVVYLFTRGKSVARPRPPIAGANHFAPPSTPAPVLPE